MNRFKPHPRRATSRTILIAVMFLCVMDTRAVSAQDGPWKLSETGGAAVEWPTGVPTPDRPGTFWKSALLAEYRLGGYFSARVDSVVEATRTVYVAEGPEARLSELVVDWTEERVGVPPVSHRPVLSQDVLEGLLDTMLAELSDAGFLAATAGVTGIQPADSGYAVQVQVNSGIPTVVDEVIFRGDDRSVSSYRHRVAGMKAGTPAGLVDRSRIRRRVASAPGIRRAGDPVFERTSDTTAVLVVPVDVEPPGRFDLTVGLLPSTESRPATLTGGGHIQLLNAFGAGRRMDVRLDRRPGQVSAADVALGDPMILGSPFGVDVAFNGLQQDSSYAHRAWSAGVAYRLDEQLQVGLRWKREVTRPGQGGTDVPHANATFAGVELEYRRVDDPVLPRQGMVLESLFERGQRSVPGMLQRVERLSVDLRLYIPIGDRGVFVTGGDARLVRGKRLDRSQLIRFGGASTLRGYDEDRFLVETAVRMLAEWRYLFEASSYVFSFVDVGLLDRQATDAFALMREVLPGLGVGMIVETAAGWVNVTWAVNTRESIRNGRIHIGLAFGL